MLWEKWRTYPRLIRFLATHFADGVALGCAFGLLPIWFGVGNIGSLLERHGRGLLTALFFLQSGLLFGTLAMSVAVMNLREDD